MQVDPKSLIVYVPDTRGVTMPLRYGKGNMKIGMEAYTYSKLPGLPTNAALGEVSMYPDQFLPKGTCPGATSECLAICYASRPVAEASLVYKMWRNNSGLKDLPPIPEDARFLRIHVGGDFDTYDYICQWVARLTERPDVTAWAYTRSWRVAELLPALDSLRKLPNMQLFASMDPSTDELPPPGWRIAWIQGDRRLEDGGEQRNHLTYASATDVEAVGVSYICPEETGHRDNCLQCGYCLKGQTGDVTFLRH